MTSRGDGAAMPVGTAIPVEQRMISRPLLATLALALAYGVVGWLGLQLATPPGYATVIWPASGLAMASLFLFGRHLWPGILLGSFLVNSFVGEAFAGGSANWTALINASVIATGSTLQGLFGVFLIRRFLGEPVRLESVGDILKLVFLAGPLACLAAATIGVGSLVATGVVSAELAVRNWLTWWIGDIGGVLLVLPIALLSSRRDMGMLWRDAPMPVFSPGALLAILVLLFATLAAWRLTAQNAYERNSTAFEALATDSEEALRSRMGSYRQTLDGAAALFQASQVVSLREWQTYAMALDIKRNLPGIGGIGYIEPVEASQVDEYLARTRAKGIRNLTIHPQTQADEKFISTFIEPLAENAEAVGLDIAFETNRREAARSARDTGRTRITKQILLMQDETESAGFLLLKPMYRSGAPLETIPQRREAFEGWIYAPFVAPRFLERLTASQGGSFEMTVFDGDSADAGEVIYRSFDDGAASRIPKYSVQRTLEVMDQPWTVRWSSTPAFERRAQTGEAVFVLVGGLLLTFFFGYVLLSASRREADTQREVDKRTRELESTVAALAESERRFGDLAGLSPAGIIQTDRYGFCTYVNDAWLEESGLDASAALGAGWLDAVHPDDRERVRREWVKVIGEAKPYRSEFRFKPIDGDARCVDLLATPQFDGNDELIGFIGVAVDITEHRIAVDALQESERRFQALANFSPAGIFRTDADGACAYVNLAWTRMAGIAANEVMGHGWAKVVHKDDMGRVARGWMRAVEAKSQYRDEFRWKHEDGSVVWVDVAAKPELNDAGLLRGFIGVVLDITERKRFEAELADRDEQLSLLARNATDAVLRIGLDGRCIYASPSAKDVLDLDPKSLKGASILESFHPEDEQRVKAAFEDLALGKRERFVIAYRSSGPDVSDVYRWYEANAGLVRDSTTGEPSEVLASIRDITDRKQMEFDLVEARRNAEAASAAKANFLANMSHEIRTPMNGVIGFTELLLNEDVTARQRKHLEMIAKSGRTMMQILNDILDMSKIEAGRMGIAAEPVDLRQELESCIKLVEPGARQKDLDLDLDVADDLPEYVLVDPLRLRQIVTNLLGNAVKFTDRGAVAISATGVIGEDGEHHLQIAVNDTGVGIAPQRLTAIFQQFTQADNSTARRFGGTGLGLSISSQLAILMGGELTAESEEGKGSTFTLFLPLKPVEQPQGLVPNQAREFEGVLEGKPSRVLIAEDHDINQALIVSMARQIGLEPAIACNGEEAVEMMKAAQREGKPYALVLMDIQMPLMDGIEATKRIRAAGFKADRLPIIALTANAYPEDIERCLAAGMQAHISKPIRLAELKSVSGTWLGETDRGGSDASKASPAPPEADPQEALMERYRMRKSEAFKALASLSETSDPKRNDVEHVADLLHKLAGTAGFFGEEQLGEIARVQENSLLAAEPNKLANTIAEAKKQIAEWCDA